LTEDWDEYETLKTKLTRIEGVHEIVNDGIALTAATDGPNVANELTGHATVEVQGANVVTEGQTNGIRQRTITDDCEEVTVTSLNEDDNDEVTVVDQSLSFQRDTMFASPTELLDLVSEYAKARNFTVRRDKHAIVCSNAGESNWTTVTDYEARAKQTFRKRHTHQNEGIDDTIEDILQTEEEKVATPPKII
jgi:hypothetical protein